MKKKEIILSQLNELPLTLASKPNRSLNSLLVKTFFSSNELNFGRIFMAIGKSNETINQEKISFSLDNQLLAKNGTLLIKNNSNKIKKCMNKKELSLEINLNNGKSHSTIYTCDLTNEYIKINTSYLS